MIETETQDNNSFQNTENDQEEAEDQIQPGQTIYINNLNERIKKEVLP